MAHSITSALNRLKVNLNKKYNKIGVRIVNIIPFSDCSYSIVVWTNCNTDNHTQLSIDVRRSESIEAVLADKFKIC